jgi:DNA-binding MarR family transcriptional regulator
MYDNLNLLHNINHFKVMKTKDILIELIQNLDEYEIECNHSNTEINITDFLGFLLSHHQSVNVKAKDIAGNLEHDNILKQDDSSTDISILIVLMFRYAKSYMRKALKNSMIKTADEFSFLITLITYDNLTKTELIQKQVMEKTSGTEIINRLLKLGLINQFNDLEDKRSVRIQITTLGKEQLFEILPQMRNVSQIVTGNLSETEKLSLAYMLRKLDIFHNDIYMNKKDIELSDLL